MNAQDAEIREKLLGAGIRCTRKRLELARLLFGQGDRHITAETLWKEAFDTGSRVSLATVYNTLHEFVSAGMLSATYLDADRMIFDTNTTPHHHAVDVNSGEIYDIPPEAVQLAEGVLPQSAEIEKVDVVIRVRNRQS